MGGITGGERKKTLTEISNSLATLQQAIDQGHHDGTIESLRVVRTLKGILESSEDLAALAALDGMSMAKIGAEIDRSETSVPMMLARTQRLAPYVENPRSPGGQVRISTRALGAAEYDLRRRKGLNSNP